MHFEKEYSNQYNFYIPFITSDMNYAEHFHGDFELLYVIFGQICTTIDSTDYVANKGDFVMIFPNQSHSYRSIGATKCFVCIFSADMVDSFARMVHCKLPDSPVFTLDNMSVLHDLIMYRRKDTLLLQSYLFYICSEFIKKRTFRSSLPQNRILKNQVSDYVSQHFTEHLTLHDIADDLGYNYQYISRFFSQNFSTNFRSFVNMYRIDYAKHILSETEDPITEVALASGYDSIRSFNRAFVQITGLTPSSYRSSVRENLLNPG